MSGTGSLRARRIAAAVLILGLAGLLLGVTSRARLARADLVINNGAEVSTLDPATVTGVPEGRVLRSIFEGLVTKAYDTLEPQPGMAESWELSEDGLTYVFHVRDDAVWTNGDPVTAHDFEWSWERLLNPETAAEYAYQLWYVRGAKAYSLMPDDRLFRWPGQGSWLQEVAEGRFRLGLAGYGSYAETEDPGTRFRLPFAVNEVIEDGDAVWTSLRADGDDGWHLDTPVTGRVVAVNPDLPDTLGGILGDPYGAHWLCELEVEPESLARALEERELQDAATFRREVLWPAVGIRATDDRTLVVELKAPTPYFIDLCGFYSLFPVNRKNIETARETWPDTWQVEWVRPENIVTNGPYRVEERRVNDRIRLVKFEDYWDADSVAMRTLDFLAVEHYGTMLNLYLMGEVDWIERVPPNLTTRILLREDFRPQPYLGTYFYRVNTTKPPFDDRRVRRALALTIDRKAICEKIMKAGQIPNFALCPAGLPGYDPPEMAHAPLAADLSDWETSFEADCEEARGLMKQAGYGADGTPLPTIEIHYNTSEAHRDIAEVVADSWKRHLGLDAKLLNQEWKVYLETQSNLGYDVSRSAWIGDYPDPNTFLDLFVTGGENNKTGWGDPRYDQLIHDAAAEPDVARRIELLREAESLLVQELPILPIYTYVTQNVRKPRLGGFAENVLDEHFPKHFYWMDDEELAAARAALPEKERVEPGGPPEGLYPPNAARRGR